MVYEKLIFANKVEIYDTFIVGGKDFIGFTLHSSVSERDLLGTDLNLAYLKRYGKRTPEIIATFPI